MVRQNRLTIPESLRVAKAWYELVQLRAPEPPIWNYWDVPQATLTDIGTRYALTEVMDWAPPYNKSLEKLRILLKCVSTYLSRGNVEAPLDIWLQAAAEGNLAAERAALLAGDPNAENSSVAATVQPCTISYCVLRKEPPRH